MPEAAIVFGRLRVVLAQLDLVFDGVVALSGNLGSEEGVYQLILAGVPLTIRVSIIHHFIRSCIVNFDGRVAYNALCPPVYLAT